MDKQERVDPETKKITDEQKAVREMTQSEGYGFVKQRLINRISALIDISNLDMKLTPEALAVEAKSKKLAAEILLLFLSVDIEATAEMAEPQGLTLNEESYIVKTV